MSHLRTRREDAFRGAGGGQATLTDAAQHLVPRTTTRGPTGTANHPWAALPWARAGRGALCPHQAGQSWAQGARSAPRQAG